MKYKEWFLFNLDTKSSSLVEFLVIQVTTTEIHWDLITCFCPWKIVFCLPITSSKGLKYLIIFQSSSNKDKGCWWLEWAYSLNKIFIPFKNSYCALWGIWCCFSCSYDQNQRKTSIGKNEQNRRKHGSLKWVTLGFTIHWCSNFQA